jgi:predicted nuclease with RNAse H fold
LARHPTLKDALMRTVGVDLAAGHDKTAIAIIEWDSGKARLSDVVIPADDAAVLECAEGADKVGIDCPLGWPDTFLTFLYRHHFSAGPIDTHTPAEDWRRSMAYRLTDEHVRERLGIVPLSVSTDRIGLTAMRAARIQGLLAKKGCQVDRLGKGLIVEVYPAAGLEHWQLDRHKYKGGKNAEALTKLTDTLLERTRPWLDLGDHKERCGTSDHVFDAVIAALIARACALGKTDPPDRVQRDRIAREGWIALPTCPLEELAG